MPSPTDEPIPGEGRRRRIAGSRASSGKIWAIAFCLAVLILGIGLYLFKKYLSRERALVHAEIFEAEMRFKEEMEVRERGPESALDELLRTAHQARFTGQPATHDRLGYAERLLDLSKFDLSEDLAAYREIVRPVAEATRFVPVLADRAERLGYPAFVAAVGMLQEMNYKDGLDCQKAQNLQRLLGQMSGVDSLVASVFRALEPSASETSKFIAVAGGWRSIAEEFANSDSAYRDLLVMTGKSGSTGDSRKPR